MTGGHSRALREVTATVQLKLPRLGGDHPDAVVTGASIGVQKTNVLRARRARLEAAERWDHIVWIRHWSALPRVDLITLA
jgi:hypothetical protein